MNFVIVGDIVIIFFLFIYGGLDIKLFNLIFFLIKGFNVFFVKNCICDWCFLVLLWVIFIVLSEILVVIIFKFGFLYFKVIVSILLFVLIFMIVVLFFNCCKKCNIIFLVLGFGIK